ncbi:MAG: hypothetical protein HZC40_15180 [Chloroflexi bacterium]|nr:hypothetical protein [Chloroflexota bacterium]
MSNNFEIILDSRPDPLDVLKTAARVVEHARFVRINSRALERAADTLAQNPVAPPAWNYELHYHDGTERTVNYLFLLDALNFCFWGKPKWRVEYRGKTLDGYWALAASLKRAAETNPDFLAAEFLAQITPQELADALRGTGEIPLFAERWRSARELGTALKNLWNGQAAHLVECADRDAARLARMIVENLTSFNDIAVYEIRAGAQRRRGAGEKIAPSHRAATKLAVYIFKRAQILVTDLWGAFGGKDWGAFENIDALTAFADYKLPQILRAWKILEYTPSLAKKVDAQIELAAGSRAEIEIRAAMLWAVEFLRAALAQRGRALMSLQVDWILWEASQALGGMKPYHRVRTIYY